MKRLVVDSRKIAKNLDIIKKHTHTQIIAVLKGNAYGLGLCEVADILALNGITRFAVTQPEDALILRNSGFNDAEILILRSTACEQEINTIIESCATATIGSNDSAIALNGIAQKQGIIIDAHIELDTGMGRYGFLPTEFDKIRSIYQNLGNVNVTGIYTHFHSAFSSKKSTLEQFSRLNIVVSKLRDASIDPGMVHAANSAATLLYPEVHGDAVRVGSAFTGRIPIKDKKGLEKVSYLESNVVEIRHLPKGHSVGYGAGFVTKRPTKVAIVPVGYDDGFCVEKIRDIYRLRDIIRYMVSDLCKCIKKHVVFVKIGQKRCRVLGHVGMCHTVVDVTGSNVSVGDIAVFDASPIYVNSSMERCYE